MDDTELFCLIVTVGSASDGLITTVGDEEYVKKMYKNLGLALTDLTDNRNWLDFGLCSVRRDLIIGYLIRSFENLESDEVRLKASQMYTDRQVLGL